MIIELFRRVTFQPFLRVRLLNKGNFLHLTRDTCSFMSIVNQCAGHFNTSHVGCRFYYFSGEFKSIEFRTVIRNQAELEEFFSRFPTNVFPTLYFVHDEETPQMFIETPVAYVHAST